MEACPVCGVLIHLHLLEAHVNSHFDEHPGLTSHINEPDIPTARCTVCGALVPLVMLDRHERDHESASAATAAYNPPAPLPPAAATSSSHCLPSIICPYGCGQWIPVSELDSHELAHVMMAEGGQGPPLAPVGFGPGPGPSDIGGGDDEWMQAGLDDSYLYDDTDELYDTAAASEAAARRLQEEQDFEALRAKYGFSDK
ncbi:hypothetical protein VOLCADRAFT_118291, partial [Volvox carteri f. nagariensis]